jgi:hypothetical protein
MGSDPGLALVERVTNGIDAVVNLAAQRQGNVSEVRTPREAALAWFNVSTGGFNALTAGQRRSLGLMVRVRLEDSSEPRRPTVVIEDTGEGQTPALMPMTLLSLNESNKADLPWTMGTYGQGGSVALGFARATLILSRRHPTLSARDASLIGWTLVTEHPAGENGQKYPNYQYLVVASNDVPTLDAKLLPELNGGTKVTHIAYDLQRLTGPVTTQLWQFLHSALFELILPFELSGSRRNDPANNSRIIVGNRARLDRPVRPKNPTVVGLRAGDLGQPPYVGVRVLYPHSVHVDPLSRRRKPIRVVADELLA